MTDIPDAGPRIEVHEDRDDLAVAVAGELVARLVDAQVDGGVPQIALTGGSVADAVHRELTRLSEESETGGEVDWSRVVIWWGDERFVEPASPDRNERQAREAFLDQVDVDPANVHPMPSTESAETAEAGAAAYGEELRTHGSGTFEIVMLGLGPDAHVASLFPGYPQLDLDEVAVAVHDSPKPPPTGSPSRSPVSTWPARCGSWSAARTRPTRWPWPCAEGTDVHEAPAAGVSGQDETIWFLDRAAASRL